jgi:hypothetical protein
MTAAEPRTVSAVRGGGSPVLPFEARRAARVIARAESEAKRARARIDSLRIAASIRLGVEVPNDPVVIDVLEAVDVGPGDIWYWTGRVRSDHGYPVIRLGRLERSVVRLLAIGFGLVDEGAPLLYPRNARRHLKGGADDMNPWHRLGVAMPKDRPETFKNCARESGQPDV